MKTNKLPFKGSKICLYGHRLYRFPCLFFAPIFLTKTNFSLITLHWLSAIITFNNQSVILQSYHSIPKFLHNHLDVPSRIQCLWWWDSDIPTIFRAGIMHQEYHRVLNKALVHLMVTNPENGYYSSFHFQREQLRC